MSDYEYKVGKAVNLTEKYRKSKNIVSFDALVMCAMREVSFDYLECTPEYVDWKNKDGSKEIVYANADFWLITYDLEQCDTGYINHGTKKDNGEIEFAFCYYNGGTHFDNEFNFLLNKLK